MDFFAAQAEARRRTALLLGLFALVVLAVVGVLDLLATGLHLLRHGRPPPLEVHAWVSGAALALIVGGSLWRTAELRHGTGTLARLLRARPLDDADLASQLGAEQLLRYRNTAAEVAIAAGAPLPQLYVLPRQQAINALAAGSATGDAALFLTAGALSRLEREELLGVLAHEFGHLLSGDGRLNVRLLGALHGLLMVSRLGHVLLGQERSGAALRVAGLVLLAIGSVGVFAGRLLRAAVSRQREFHADASAVRLTRNPDGLLGALRKIRLARPLPEERRLEREFEHMLFSAVDADTARVRWLATHPPLRERIARISGRMAAAQDGYRAPDAPTRMTDGVAADAASRSEPARGALVAGGVSADLERARAWQRELPQRLREDALAPVQALGVMSLLLGVGTARPPRDTEQPLTPAAAWTLACRLVPALAALSPTRQRRLHHGLRQRLLTLPRLSPLHVAAWLLVRHHLAQSRSDQPPPQAMTQPGTAEALLLSLLAHAGSGDQAAAARAFALAAADLALRDAALMPAEHCRLLAIEGAVDGLSRACGERRHGWLRAAVKLVEADEVTLQVEQALLHAIAESLDCPLPAGATLRRGAPPADTASMQCMTGTGSAARGSKGAASPLPVSASGTRPP